MIEGLKIFIEGSLKFPLWVKLWMMILGIVNGVLPLFFLDYLAAQVSIVAITAGVLIAVRMCVVTGFNKYLALMHGPWVPLLFVLGSSLWQYDGADSYYFYWLVSSVVVTALSLILDIYDFLTYRQS